MVARKRIALTCQWVKSHGEDNPQFFSKYILSVRDCLGNCCAARLAIRAANAAELPRAAAVPVLQLIAYTQLIQRRLVAILRGLVRDFPSVWCWRWPL